MGANFDIRLIFMGFPKGHYKPPVNILLLNVAYQLWVDLLWCIACLRFDKCRASAKAGLVTEMQ